MNDRLTIEQDDQRDVVTINGVLYSREFFRSLGIGGLDEGRLLRIVKRDQGVLTVQSFAPGEVVTA